MLFDWLGYLDVLGARALLSLGLNVVGAGLMLWGAWQEYQVEKPSMPSFGGTPSSAPAAAQPGTTDAPAAPAAPPPASPDDRPPA
jgi:hypothetical protein